METKSNKEKNSLYDFKKKYDILKKKYNLPEFELLNEDFSIEKVYDIETDFLLREIRRLIADKYNNYMRLVEIILNPINAPVFIFSVIKLIGKDEKIILENLFKTFMKIELTLIELDLIYSEENESKFIKNSFEEWQIIKQDLSKIINKIKLEDNKTELNNKGYFG